MTSRRSPEAPEHLHLGPPDQRVRFVLQPDLVALHGPRPKETAASVVLSLPDAGVDVLRTVDAPDHDPRRRGPVYAQEPAGPLAVPTGRVFLRLGKGPPAPDWVARLEQLGFAPVRGRRDVAGAAWIEPIGGRIGRGLARLEPLAALAEVEGAEPELLRESRRR